MDGGRRFCFALVKLILLDRRREVRKRPGLRLHLFGCDCGGYSTIFGSMLKKHFPSKGRRAMSVVVVVVVVVMVRSSFAVLAGGYGVTWENHDLVAARPCAGCHSMPRGLRSLTAFPTVPVDGSSSNVGAQPPRQPMKHTCLGMPFAQPGLQILASGFSVFFRSCLLQPGFL